MENQIALPENYEDICNNISNMILTAQKKAFYAVNTSHIMLNWNIGRGEHIYAGDVLIISFN